MITESQIQEIISRKFQGEPYLDKLSKISEDDANRESLITGFDNHRFYNYDEITKSLYKGDPPKSADMILFREDEIVFVEFKNGRIEGRKRRCSERDSDDECKYVEWDIKLKSIEGGFIVLHKIVSKEWDDIKFADIVNLNKTYILVYNEEKNPSKIVPLKSIKENVSACEIKYGLHIYNKTFFLNVHTFPKAIFLEWLNKFILEAPL